MDLLFKEYASPFILLDEVIRASQLNDFIDTFESQREERQVWEYYLNKLSPWDDRSFDQFKRDLHLGTKTEKVKPSKEQLETTVKNSYSMLKHFEIKQEGGERS